MRMLLVLILSSVGGSRVHAESPKPRTDLLSYDEVMRLTPQKRVRYFSDLAFFLALLEQKTEKKYDAFALESLRRQRREVAWWLEFLRADDAHADDAVTNEDLIDPNGDTPAALKTFNRGLKKQKLLPATSSTNTSTTPESTPTTPASSEPAKTTAAAEPAPATTPPASGKGMFQAMYDYMMGHKDTAPTEEARAREGSASSTRSVRTVDMTPGADNSTRPQPAAPAAAKPAAEPPKPWEDPPRLGGFVPPSKEPGTAFLIQPNPALNTKPAGDVVDKCPAFPPKCDTSLTKEKKRELILAFRKGSQYNKCIAGGYFSPKVGNRRAGSCGFKTKEPFEKSSISCDDGRSALCNPMLFCLRYANLAYRKAKDQTPVAQQAPIGLCVPRGPNVTRECFDRYNATLGIGPVKKRWDWDALDKQAKRNPKLRTKIAQLKADPNAVPVACDFNNTTTPGLKEKYEELRAETQQGYRELCELTPGDQAGFRELFCEECGIISKQLHVALNNAGHGCAPAAPIPPDGGVGPGSNGATGATREN